MSTSLHTWKLVPTGIPSAQWYFSTVRTELHIRAEGPLQARELAAHEFRQSARDAQADEASPWLDPDLVCCTELDDEQLAAIDRPCVLCP